MRIKMRGTATVTAVVLGRVCSRLPVTARAGERVTSAMASSSSAIITRWSMAASAFT